MEEERFRRVRELVRMFSGEGLLAVHENCMNYGGMGWTYTLRLLDRVPGLKLVFDTGNPVFTEDRTVPPPFPRQSSWDFYSHVKDHVEYVHVKDGVWDEKAGKPVFTWPGEGRGDVRRIIEDLVRRGYKGGISIEPHMAVVFHDGAVRSEAEVRMANYIEYGRRIMGMLDEITGRKL
jgi:sugar phosphate isomerase/epimerase